MKIDATTSDEQLRAELLTCDFHGREVKATALDELLRRQRPTAVALPRVLGSEELDNPLCSQPVGEPRVIGHYQGSFVLSLLGGSEAVCEFGWTLVSCSGLPCSYATRSKDCVRRTVALGWTLDESAKLAMIEAPDDLEWAAEREQERHAHIRLEDQQASERERMRQILVASARAKLTKAEFDAVVQEGWEH